MNPNTNTGFGDTGWTPLNDRLVFQPLDGVSAELTDADYEFLADAAKDSE